MGTILFFQIYQSESPVNNIDLLAYFIDKTIHFVCCFLVSSSISQFSNGYKQCISAFPILKISVAFGVTRLSSPNFSFIFLRNSI